MRSQSLLLIKLVNIDLSFLTGKISHRITTVLVNLIVLAGLMPHGIKLASAQTLLACDEVKQDLLNLSNLATVGYKNEPNGGEIKRVTNRIITATDPSSEANLTLRLIGLGVEDLEGNAVNSLGAIALDISELLSQEGFGESDAATASLVAVRKWASLLPETSSVQVAKAIKQEIAASMESENSEFKLGLANSALLTVLAGFGESSLKSLGLSPDEVEQILQTTVEPQAQGDFTSQIETVTQSAATKIDRPAGKELLIAAQERSQQELNNIRSGEQTKITAGSQVVFKFRLDNQRDKVAKIELPNAEAITANGLTGSGKITGVNYSFLGNEETPSHDLTQASQLVSIPAQTSLDLNVEVEVGKTSDTEVATIEVDLQPSCGRAVAQSFGILPPTSPIELIDPLGQITGCAGETLPEYQGFSVALYEPDPGDPTGSSVQNLTTLTETELPDEPNNNVPGGIEPNTQNSNPFFLVNSDRGKYSFLFDSDRNQLDRGATYILQVTPPENSIYDARRVKLVIEERTQNIVEYTATSLDGKPISATDGQTTVTGEIVVVEDAERVGLDLAVLNLASSICDAQEIQITKTGDRASAEPGDIILYRLAVRNLASSPITNLQVTDTLPPGFKLEETSVRAEIDEAPVKVSISQNGRTFNITSEITLPSDATINLVYGAQVTPNALRGPGRNSAIVNAQRTDNNLGVQDGPAIHTLRLEARNYRGCRNFNWAGICR